MMNFKTYIANRQPDPRPNLGKFKHADVSLLAHMAIIVCSETYELSGQLPSRDACFGIAFNFVTDHLWPLVDVVPPSLGERSVFLGHGRYERGSFRKWAGELHGLVHAQLLVEGVAGRRRSRAGSRVKKIRDDAELHLQDIINAVARHATSSPALLLAELQQLQKDLF